MLLLLYHFRLIYFFVSAKLKIKLVGLFFVHIRWINLIEVFVIHIVYEVLSNYLQPYHLILQIIKTDEVLKKNLNIIVMQNLLKTSFPIEDFTKIMIEHIKYAYQYSLSKNLYEIGIYLTFWRMFFLLFLIKNKKNEFIYCKSY